MRIGFWAVLIFAAFAMAFPANAAGGFSDWGAIIVAGDYRAHNGDDSEVFDDARHDIGAALERVGFQSPNVVEFSVRPARYSGPLPQQSDPLTISNGLWDLSNRTNAGCFIYFTSHGSPDGVVVGDSMIAPNSMATMVNNACGSRPTVVVVSACFSGVFVPTLAAPNRMVLTAARPDRTSFGCGQSNRYTYFDECFLDSMPGSHDFPGLATAVRACVAAREVKEKASPASEPQLFIGADAMASLPRW
jgi:hypothetical protein